MRKVILCEICERKVSLRIKKALKRYKAKGGKLGSLNPKTKIGLKTYQEKLKARTALALKKKLDKERKHEKKVLAIIGRLRKQGKTIGKITAFLNKRGVKTKHGNKYHPTSVYRIMRSL